MNLLVTCVVSVSWISLTFKKVGHFYIIYCQLASHPNSSPWGGAWLGMGYCQKCEDVIPKRSSAVM